MRQIPINLGKSLWCFLFFNVLLSQSLGAFAQNLDFDFGKVSTADLKTMIYEKDTSAIALVLNETGNAYIDTENGYELVVNYHVKIKILKPQGVEKANVEIPLRKRDNKREQIFYVQASSFNLVDGVVTEAKMNNKALFDEDAGKFYDLKKFTIPNVSVGSVIEYKFTLQTPFIYNFYTWEFQSDIPKRKSEYWAKMPGNYVYNISLRGAQNLSLNENEIIKKCVVISEGSYGSGTHADCVRFKFAMENIPAFKEEDYMTAKTNFLSAIYFELSEVRYFTGKVDKITKEWKDVEQELRFDRKFGVQIKRGKEILGDQLTDLIGVEKDSLVIANKIYDFIKEGYQWNGVYGIFSEFGVKEALLTKKGNVGDINLTLIAALKFVGFPVDPLILSTRKNGLPTDAYPVISDFNYVIAKVKIGGKTYLLDATDDFMPFGMIPERCFNGRGRVLSEKGSYWYEVKPSERARLVTICNLHLESSGKITGEIQRTFAGYRAVDRRKEIQRFSDRSAYESKLNEEFNGVRFLAINIDNPESLAQPVKETLSIELTDFISDQPANFLFNPFVSHKLGKNPFKSETRNYPVDFGIPLDETYILTLHLPENISLTALPEKIALILPGNGGKYIYDFRAEGNKIILTNLFSISRTVYSAEEYHYVRELYSRMIQSQNIDLVLTKK